MIKAEVIRDSISEDGYRLTTIECTFHRFILAEFNTHRAFSRNASSSRAIPITKRIAEVRENPAIPVEWGKNQRGMVSDGELDTATADECLSVWLEAAKAAADYAEYLAEKKLHKQVIARILEPFLWHTSVVSATDYENMFNQRIHEDAQPEFRALAEAMKDVYEASQPREVERGGWHLPYIREEEERRFDLDFLKKISVSRVAKTSYGNQGKVNLDKDIELYDRLITQEPIHYSPLEHVATPVSWPATGVLGNFVGWRQLRHLLK